MISLAGGAGDAGGAAGAVGSHHNRLSRCTCCCRSAPYDQRRYSSLVGKPAGDAGAADPDGNEHED